MRCVIAIRVIVIGLFFTRALFPSTCKCLHFEFFCRHEPSENASLTKETKKLVLLPDSLPAVQACSCVAGVSALCMNVGLQVPLLHDACQQRSVLAAGGDDRNHSGRVRRRTSRDASQEHDIQRGRIPGQEGLDQSEHCRTYSCQVWRQQCQTCPAQKGGGQTIQQETEDSATG